ncbi:MAG: cellulose biosynthesis cyclic di-GMP-binding regulatory protein BcsB, partial [Hyphomicrobiales bacterium]|nr:cellulose biosynthesis cyclic di-GMP-binding regulatory protein BcsB [Hyphomicrobiales bacterium]
MRIQSRAAAAALAVGLTGLTASFDRAARAAEPAGAVQPAAAPTLKRLPAGRDELVFHGESSTKIWPVYLSQAEASHAASLQFALLNAVVVLPERSSLTVVVNGRPFPALPVHSADKTTILSVRMPPGALTAGVNKVQVSTTLAHRVDCTVPATYELWAQLDPARTGFLIDGAVATVHSLDDLAAEPTADDGATHIHLRMADPLWPDAIARASRLIDALVRRAGLPRPIVDIGPESGQGPGFDVVLTPGSPADAGLENVRVVGRSDGATIARDADTKRLVIVVSGDDDAQLDAAIDAIDGGGAKSSAAKTERASAVEHGFRRSFGDLGLVAEGFAGRRFAATARIDLPADFFPVSSEKARLVIDGGHSNAVGRDSELRVSVNGALAASLPLAAGKGEHFERRGLELPLRLFHPGANELAIEAITASPLDQQCDLSAQSREARLTLAATSELDFPSFTRLATVPRIPLTAGTPDQHLQHLYLGSLDRDTVGAALTILANAAPPSGVEPPVLHPEPPVESDAPGLVVASYGQIPEGLASQLSEVAAPPAPADAATAAAPVGGETAAPNGADATALETGIAARAGEALARVGRLGD